MSSSTNKAVFLSYASQDAEAAQRIVGALRAAGMEVWFDQNELAGGDAWDAKIRSQIAACALFVPVISAATQARREGYFRLEWKLAAQRTHTMADGTPFLLPVVIDATRDAEALVPPEFKAVQWTRLPGGENAEKFCARVAKLLGATAAAVSAPLSEGPGSAPVPGAAVGVPPAASVRQVPPRRLLLAGLALGGVALGAALLFWLRPASAPGGAVAAVAPLSTSVPAPEAAAATPTLDVKSLAVLPFANLSGDPAQEYFSDGLTEEILNVLSREKDLRVIARTSAFSFKGKNVPLTEIARTLGVARLVEGSVRRAGDRVRITVQLIRAADGFAENLGSFDRQLTDVFALQDEVARAVLEKITRRTATATGPVQLTANPAAYDAYLRGRALAVSGQGQEKAIAHFREAVTLAPDFALAWASLAEAALGAYRGGRDNSPQRLALIKEALARAQALQPASPDVLYVAALLAASVDRDAATATKLLAQARSLGLEDIRWSAGQIALAEFEPRIATAIAIFNQHGEALLRLDPQNRTWINNYGNFARNTGAYPKAEALFLRAVRLGDADETPGLTNLIDNRLRWRGPASALALLERIAPAHPASPALRGRLHHWLGRDEEARLAFAQALERPSSIMTDSPHWSGGGWLDLCTALGSVPDQAKETLELLNSRYAAGNQARVVLANIIQLEHLVGHTDRARALLNDLSQSIASNQSALDVNPHTRVAGLLATTGQNEAALSLLEKVWSTGVIPSLDLRWNPRFASLRGDPRFQAWVRLAEQHSASLPDPVDP